MSILKPGDEDAQGNITPRYKLRQARAALRILEKDGNEAQIKAARAKVSALEAEVKGTPKPPARKKKKAAPAPNMEDLKKAIDLLNRKPRNPKGKTKMSKKTSKATSKPQKKTYVPLTMDLDPLQAKARTTRKKQVDINYISKKARYLGSLFLENGKLIAMVPSKKLEVLK